MPNFDGNTRVDRFLAYVAESNVSALPRTMVLYRGDEVVATVELEFDPEIEQILESPEWQRLFTTTLGEMIVRYRATAALVAGVYKTATCGILRVSSRFLPGVDLTEFLESDEVAVTTYESRTEAVFRVNLVSRDGGAVRFGRHVAAVDPQAYFKNTFAHE